MISAVLVCSAPSGSRQRSSIVSPSGPSVCASVSRSVRSFAPAVALLAHGLGVDAERDVVDEDAPVHLPQVYITLASLDEGVERPDDVFAVDPEVEGEVVARARRDAGVGKVVLGRDRGDDRLRAVASGHRQAVRPPPHRRSGQLGQVLAGVQLDDLVAAPLCLSAEVQLRGASFARAGVEEEHRVPWRLGAGQRAFGSQRLASPRDRGAEGDRDDDQDPAVLTADHDPERDPDQERGEGHAEDARRAAAQDRRPGDDQGAEDAGEDDEAAGEVADEDVGGHPQREGAAEQGEDCARPPAHMIARWPAG
jgi:hypothetical protein